MHFCFPILVASLIEFNESFVWLTGALGICGVLKLKFVVFDEKE